MSQFSKEIGDLEEVDSQKSMSENDLTFTPGLQKEAFSNQESNCPYFKSYVSNFYLKNY